MAKIKCEANKNLFELSAPLVEINAAVETADGEISEEIEKRIADWLSDGEGELLAKLDSISWWYAKLEQKEASLDGICDQIKKQLHMFSRKQQVAQNAMLRLEKQLGDMMIATGRDKEMIETTSGWKIGFVGHGGKQKLEIDEAIRNEPTKLPMESGFIEQLVVLRDDLIRERLESGVELEWARLLPRGRSLRIR
jgi:Siphovirus Gp157